MSCNGWKNSQTWTISLWYGDCFADMANEQRLFGDYLEEMVVEMEMDKIPESGLAADVMNDFLRKVDWDELADHYNADSLLNEDEEYDGMGNRLDGTGALGEDEDVPAY